MDSSRMLPMLALSLMAMLWPRVGASAGSDGLDSSRTSRSKAAFDTIGLPEILRALPDADSVIVARIALDRKVALPKAVSSQDRPGVRERGALPVRQPRSQETEIVGRPGREWRERLAGTLLKAQRLERPCVPLPTPEDTTPRMTIAVRAYHGPRLRHVTLHFAERCALISDKPYGASVDIAPIADALLELAREALPQDAWLRTAALPPAASAPRTPPPPSIVVAPPTAEERPKFGEYVYVEELPEAIERPRPVMPAKARASGITGVVQVQVLVGKDGLVKDTRIVKSIPELDEAAIECARRWTFKPALSRGGPVAVWVAIPMRFDLE